MIYLAVLLSFIYFTLILSFIISFDKVATVKNKNTTPENTFSIVIAFRNEAHNLPNLLNSLSTIKYPTHLFEILLVNDHSNDKFKPIIERFTQQNKTLNITLINYNTKTNSPKKEAISIAIKHSKFEWIVTTDADCDVPVTWLELFNQFIEEKAPLFISAPVKFREQNTLLFHFQNLNFTSLIGSTIGGFGIKKPFMCNGANLCYNKAAFIKLKGFDGNLEIASGDDIFLLEKMNTAFPNKTKYLKSKEAIVKTNAEANLTSFFNQQIRWASKASAYKSNFSKFVGLTVLTNNIILITLLITTILNPSFWTFLLLVFLQKLVVDFLLILKTSSFLNNEKSLKYFVISFIVHPFFIISTGVLSLFKSYEWKGRRFRK